MQLILPNAPPNPTVRLCLDSAARNSIDNHQEQMTLTQEELAKIDANHRRDYSAAILAGAEHSARYNCHGLTFASRRTWIFEGPIVKRILTEDGYKKLTNGDSSDVGDIVIYFSAAKNDPLHSGIVISRPNLADLIPTPMILSKWAEHREYVHAPNECPYVKGQEVRIEYYRLAP